jgi:small subunit ribosomal protein S27Ae
MAEHKDRLTCGKCSYTEFQKEQSKKNKSWH